jgi:hypothetical protein
LISLRSLFQNQCAGLNHHEPAQLIPFAVFFWKTGGFREKSMAFMRQWSRNREHGDVRR